MQNESINEETEQTKEHMMNHKISAGYLSTTQLGPRVLCKRMQTLATTVANSPESIPALAYV